MTTPSCSEVNAHEDRAQLEDADRAERLASLRHSRIELAPRGAARKPSRLLIFLPGDGASAASFSPVAMAWQLKFPGALGVILQPPFQGKRWWEGKEIRTAANRASRVVAQLIQGLQADWELLPSQTAVVAIAQGATLALELVRSRASEAVPCAIVVAYAARLSAPIRVHERVGCTVHLIHGDLDHRIPYVYGEHAYRSLKAAGADVTWDLLANAAHTIGQEGLNRGTLRAMQSIFRGRNRSTPLTLH